MMSIPGFRSFSHPRARFLALLLCAWTPLVFVSCKSVEKKTVDVIGTTKFHGRWLAKNVQVDITRAGTNSRSGLYEVDALLTADALEPGRANGYRVVARSVFYRGGRQNVVDTSAWSELLIGSGRSIPYSCTSLEPADDHMIEVGYPEEVGLR